MVKLKFSKITGIKENLALKRFFITLFLTISISLFYFNLYKFLESPKLNLVRKFEISNMFVWIESNIKNIRINVERTYEYKISYPYVIKKPFYCYNLPINAYFFDKKGEEIEVNKIEDKVCISSNIKEFIVKEVETIKNVDNFIKFSSFDKKHKIFIKNLFDFPLNLEIVIDVEKLIKKNANVYRDGILILSNVSLFFDSKVILPYGNVEYEIRED